jgi:hypothetical protein
MVDELDDLDDKVATAQSSPTGRWQIEVGGTIAWQIVVPALLEF